MRPSPWMSVKVSRNYTRPALRAFTLVEMLVVVLILAILMAVALPLYLAALSNSARRTARGNLHTLINAEQAFRLKNGRYTDKKEELYDPNIGVIDRWLAGPGNTEYTLYTSGTLPDQRSIPPGGVVACARDAQLGPAGEYGCFIPGQDTE